MTAKLIAKKLMQLHSYALEHINNGLFEGQSVTIFGDIFQQVAGHSISDNLIDNIRLELLDYDLVMRDHKGGVTDEGAIVPEYYWIAGIEYLYTVEKNQDYYETIPVSNDIFELHEFTSTESIAKNLKKIYLYAKKHMSDGIIEGDSVTICGSAFQRIAGQPINDGLVKNIRRELLNFELVMGIHNGKTTNESSTVPEYWIAGIEYLFELEIEHVSVSIDNDYLEMENITLDEILKQVSV